MLPSSGKKVILHIISQVFLIHMGGIYFPTVLYIRTFLRYFYFTWVFLYLFVYFILLLHNISEGYILYLHNSVWKSIVFKTNHIVNFVLNTFFGLMESTLHFKGYFMYMWIYSSSPYIFPQELHYITGQETQFRCVEFSSTEKLKLTNVNSLLTSEQ